MRDPNRIPVILDQLKELWTQYPDLRLGQLISNYVKDVNLYNIEDEDLINKLTQSYNKE